jgi:P pilus assembly chaperone PapD
VFNRFISAAFALFVLFAAGQASAHVIISPQRFVFEDRVRSHTVLLINGDTKKHTFRLGWRVMKMDETGQYERTKKPDPNDPFGVDKMVVFTPRQVTLEGGAKQSVRLSLRAPANLPPGEYRAHLLFDELADEDQATHQGEGQSLNIKLQVSVTVPVIVRAGALKNDAVTIDAPKLVQQGETPTLRLDLGHPPGQRSVYGLVTVKTQDSTRVGLLTNVAIYPEMSKRIVHVPLTHPLPAGTTVTVSYEGDGEYKGQVLATKQVTVQ